MVTSITALFNCNVVLGYIAPILYLQTQARIPFYDFSNLVLLRYNFTLANLQILQYQIDGKLCR
jgi:hypothetical protein